MSEIGIAVVGCGQIAEAHLMAIEATEGVCVTYCVDVDGDRAESAATRFGGEGFSTDLNDALGAPSVDAALLCFPHDLHVSCTCDTLRAGKHVLIEKPMALDETEARQMVAAAEDAGKRLMVGQSTRFTAPHQEAKRLLMEGHIGQPINVARQTWIWVDRLSTDWRRNVAACGGLYLPLFGSHDVDAMLWLLDDTPDLVTAAVRGGSGLSAGDVDGWIGLTFGDGKVGSISFSLRSKETRKTTTIVGSEGAMSIGRNNLSIDGEDVEFDTSKGQFERQMEEFVAAIREGREPGVPGTDGVRTMRVLDLARKASETSSTLAY